MLTKEQALQKIKSLVERFDEQYESYKSADYNETLTRRDFIDPFWKVLGWDVTSKSILKKQSICGSVLRTAKTK